MKESKVIDYRNPAKETVEDTLSSFLRESAQKMLQVAIEAEVNEFVSCHEANRLSNGHRRVIRNGYQPERSIQTTIGAITFQRPRVRDKGGDVDDRVAFESKLIPKHLRRSVTLDVLLPLMYLKGISTGDFQAVLSPVLGEGAKGLSPGVISALKSEWLSEYEEWKVRALGP